MIDNWEKSEKLTIAYRLLFKIKNAKKYKSLIKISGLIFAK